MIITSALPAWNWMVQEPSFLMKNIIPLAQPVTVPDVMPLKQVLSDISMSERNVMKKRGFITMVPGIMLPGCAGL